MRIYFRKPIDIIMSIAWTVILLVLIAFDVKGAIRVIFGLLFVIFIPGYILVLILFPTKDEIDIIERVALSFGLSIAIVPLVGLILNYTPWGIRLASIATSLSLLVFVLASIATIRWYKIEPEKRFCISFEMELPRDKVDRVLTISLLFAIAISIFLLIYIIATPHEGEKFTEFYILGPGGKAEGYPTNISTNETAKVIIGIANHEGKPINYTVETWLIKYDACLQFDGINDFVKANVSAPPKTIEAWVKPSKDDTVYGKTYEAENYKETGDTYNDSGKIVIRAIKGRDKAGYLCNNIKVPKGFNGPFSVTVYSKVSNNTSNQTLWRAEIYEEKKLKWKYEMKANEYREANTYQWKESPTWFFDGSKSYKIRLYWYGNLDFYVDKISILARRGGIGKSWPNETLMAFNGLKNGLQIGYLTKMENGSQSYTWFNSSIPKDGEFHYVAITFDNQIKKCYVDGELKDSIKVEGEMCKNESKFIIGNAYRFFFGYIKDVRIYNRALSQQEVKQNYIGNVTMNGLVAWWKFNEGYGSIAYDSIGNHNGTIYGCNWNYGDITHMWFLDKIEVRLNSTKVNIEKEWKPQWEYNYSFQIDRRGLFKLAFLLFKGRTQNFEKWHEYMDVERIENAYRECHLWIKVR
ncbi:MAG: DUF1616 domain-containing protein [Thermoplasmata archaeon]|nr:MAG: DUF1616 domain-containing protein [Thermoplasmata archaeon]